MPAKDEIFRLSYRSPVVAITAIVFLGLAALMWPHKVYVASYLLQGAFFTILMVTVSVVSIGDTGLVLNRSWRLAWSDIVSARRISFFGLPYILVKRRRGFTWWLPLYFLGARSMELALAARAPEGNPVRVAVEKSE